MGRRAIWEILLKNLPHDEKEYISSVDLLKWVQMQGFLQGKGARSSLNRWLRRKFEKELIKRGMLYVGSRAEPRYLKEDLRNLYAKY